MVEGWETSDGEEMETEGWERGASSSSRGIWRRLRLRVGGARREGRRRMVDSSLPAFASGSRILYQASKDLVMTELRAS